MCGRRSAVPPRGGVPRANGLPSGDGGPDGAGSSRPRGARSSEGSRARYDARHPRPLDDFPARYARTRRFTLGAPASVTVSPDGRRVLFLRSAAGDDPTPCCGCTRTVANAR